ncbi:pentulose/hexulose kinase [Synechococcus sp. PCC 7502]|uniref:FGGY-family carbohydrate kinase n=1 Tax=Synechococcus sp. PCC 7502 TaxID=1173263 RepID=UPI00029FF043|nr:FGGY-family carbohydrate kinase [Synechococcus sp. PCC 7502]AFY72850.1 pentulose/hexulose kinase [Synechococcus sp. PCC 7502]
MYLGIDFGTSGVRAIAINNDQSIVAETRTSYEINNIQSWELALKAVISQIPIEVRQKLQAIAIDGTSSTVLICNSLGQAIYPTLLYNDTRGSEVLAELRAIAPVGNITISSTSSLVKLLWLVKNLDFNLNFKEQNYYFLHQADWLSYLLHGQLGISDYHNALKLGYDPQNLQYPDWLQGLEISLKTSLQISKLLPEVLIPGQAITKIQPATATKWEINPQCLICAGTTDSTASFIASGAKSVGEAVTSLGSTLVLKILSPKPITNSDYGIYSHRFGNLWLVGGASNSGGAVLKQFFTDAELASLSLDIVSNSDLLNDLQNNPKTNLNYYPLPQMGERFPINDPQMLPRITPRPASNHEFLYGLLDGIAKIEGDGYQLLQELGASAPTKILTTGGGANNSLWTVIRQKYLDTEIIKPQHNQAAYGSAILALRGVR